MTIFSRTGLGDDGALAEVFEVGFEGGLSFDSEFLEFGLVLGIGWDVEVDGANFGAGAFCVADEEGDEGFHGVSGQAVRVGRQGFADRCSRFAVLRLWFVVRCAWFGFG